MSEKYVAAIDSGTTSVRCMVFNREGRVVSVDQREHEQIFPKAGWVEHNATEVWENTRLVASGALAKADLDEGDIAAVGITNQRETALVWDRTTGKPVYNAIVWQDTRTDAICQELGALGGGAERYKAKVGLPLATYFSGPKVRWILDNVEGARAKAEAGDLVFGNMDTWTLWNMTGGVNGGLHVTDPTNASRTMLMDLYTLSWDAGIAKDMGFRCPCCRRSGPPPRCTATDARRVRSPGYRSPAFSATSRRRPSVRPACRRVRPRTPTAPAASCY
jgi:glycerol kinase